MKWLDLTRQESGNRTAATRRRHSKALGGSLLIAVVILTTGCVPGRPTRIVEPDAVGIVRATAHPTDSNMTAELWDGTVLEIPRSAVEFDGPGISAGRLLLYGNDRDRVWYASLILLEQAAFDGCYEIDGIVYDEPESVIVLSAAWRGVGLRLPKRTGFEVPPELVDGDGLFRAGGEYPDASICVDDDGFAMGLR